ncbi:MAG TPA: GNAT family N-acetyltransferase [Acidobacteriaceae bacterium]|nr:GNAT family N-acetyltransferase [Acidobacteriaceae bacterium]
MIATNEHALRPATAVEIRPLTELSEFDLCVDLETAVWGYDPADMIPRRMFLLASRIGGQVLGAFAGGTMAGFAMALPGYRHGHSYLHSHMVGVLPEYRNLGLGRRLKLAQREDALARGFDLMEWTFDPLEIKNAHLNIARLGVVVRRYQHNFYGPSSSPLQGGLPTDRVYAEWWLRSRRVCGVLAGEQPSFEVLEQVDVPGKIYEWKATESGRQSARQVQARNAAVLEDAFAHGHTVLGYRRSENGDGSFLLGTWDEALSY